MPVSATGQYGDARSVPPLERLFRYNAETRSWDHDLKKLEGYDPQTRSYPPTTRKFYPVIHNELVPETRRRKSVKAGRTERAHQLRAYFGGVCGFCLQQTTLELNRPDTATTDHLTARFIGGDDVADNVASTCSSCNGSKGHKRLWEMFMDLAGTQGARLPVAVPIQWRVKDRPFVRRENAGIYGVRPS